MNIEIKQQKVKVAYSKVKTKLTGSTLWSGISVTPKISVTKN